METQICNMGKRQKRKKQTHESEPWQIHKGNIPNGGKRDKRTAVALKRQGVKAGVPDICLPVARNGYHGLYIELKAGKNKATKNQEKWQVFLNDQGYYAVICYGWHEAAKVIEEYLLKADNDKAAAVLQEMGK